MPRHVGKLSVSRLGRFALGCRDPRLVGPHHRFEHWRRAKSRALPGIEPQFLGHPARTVVAMPDITHDHLQPSFSQQQVENKTNKVSSMLKHLGVTSHTTLVHRRPRAIPSGLRSVARVNGVHFCPAPAVCNEVQLRPAQ